MNPIDFTLACARYVINAEPGSIIDTVRFKQPAKQPGEINADLHCHPYITCSADFWQTLDMMVKNNVDLLAITTHGESTSREMNYWQVKDLVEDMCSASKGEILYEDRGITFHIMHGGKRLTLAGCFENYTDLAGVGGAMDVLALMPDKGFEKHIRPRMPYEEYADLCREYEGLVIGAHPYTLWDPYGPKHFFRFRLATEEERGVMQETLFTDANCVDLVSSNAAWMVQSNRLLERDYRKVTGRIPLSNSDAHSNRRWTRNEIGRSGNLLPLKLDCSGYETRDWLKRRISFSDFRTYTNYTPSLQFLMSIALDFPEKDFP